jgi:hypothetical protein
MNSNEPVAWLTRDDGDGLWYSTNFKKSDDDRPLYTSPPKRQPLTEAEINDIERDGEFWDDHSPLDFARAIEAAHGIGDKT